MALSDAIKTHTEPPPVPPRPEPNDGECVMCGAKGEMSGWFMHMRTCEKCAKVIKDAIDTIESADGSPFHSVTTLTLPEAQRIEKEATRRAMEWARKHPGYRLPPDPVRKHASEVFGTDLQLSIEAADAELKRSNNAHKKNTERVI